ncbi:HipA family kinase [Dendrosporobacter sp. 1207_IL3150]|uniref:HipA family kinase n=1 Tax=Dendrosporobacter sp. 1207_IL3150 TaxID=3084054 RepID=UPI002FDB74B0
MLVAVEYLGDIGVGVTSPRLFRANDGYVYVVKFQNNRLGQKVLVNELLACRFSSLMDLCFPDGGIIQIEEPFIQKNKRLKAAKVKPGAHFASRFLNNSEYVGRRNLAKAANKSQMAGIILFDHIFHNVDRTWNRKNLLLRREANAYRLYAIDNSHLFRRGKWTIESLSKLADKIGVNKRRSFGWLLKYYLSKDDFAPYIAQIKAITNSQLSILVTEIPTEWLPEQSEREALFNFLVKRRDMIDKIADEIFKLIPNVNRAANINQNK